MAAKKQRLPWSGPRVAAAVTVIVLAVYLRTLAPTVTTEDSGELITAAVRWGVAHPPGYPLHTLLLQPFVRMPLWSPAFGANLASAVFGALAAGGVSLVSTELGAGARFAFAGGLLWAFGRDVWAQAVITEVYTLNALLLVAVVLFVLRFSRHRRGRDLLAAAGLFGLSLSNHYPLMSLALPSMIVFLGRSRTGVLSRRGLFVGAVALSLAGLLVYAYLPLAAARHPALSWGDPSTWDRFVAHVSRAAYRKLELGHVSSVAEKGQFLALFAEHLASQWTWPVLLGLGGLGLFRLRDRPRERDLLLGIALFAGPGLTLILNYEYDAENAQRLDEFYLPVYLALAPVLTLGLEQAADLLKGYRSSAARAANVALVAVFALPLALHFRRNDLSEDRAAHDYCALALESLSPNGVYYTSGDYTSFPTLYLQAVEGRRPDVVLADITGELSPAARAYLAEIDPTVDPADKVAVQTAFVARGPRPVFVSSRSSLAISARVEPSGLVYVVRGRARGSEPGTPPLLPSPLTLPDPVPAADGLLPTLISDYHVMRGEALFARGDREGALAAFRAAVAAEPGSKEAINNIASTAAERQFLSDAEQWYRRAAALSPTYVTPRRNLARLLDTAGRRDDAIAAYRELLRVTPEDTAARARMELLLAGGGASPSALPDDRVGRLLEAIRSDPGSPALRNNLGNVLAERGDVEHAIEAYRKAIDVDPGYALAYRNLGILHRDLLHDPAAAERYFERYRIMNTSARGE